MSSNHYIASVNGNEATVTIEGGHGTFLETTTRISKQFLAEQISEYVREAGNNGYADTPKIGVEYLLEHMDLDTFTDNLDTYIQEQFAEYIADATYDAEVTLRGEA